MANLIKIKRSATAAKVPLTSDLVLGELAINTNDGKLYLKKDDGSESIVEIGAGGVTVLDDLADVATIIAPSAHRHWRINITANDGDANYTGINEVELRIASGGADQTVPGGAASASAIQSITYEANKAVDNDTVSGWLATETVSSWWAYDFGAGNEKLIVEYTILASTPAGYPGPSPSEWTFEYSDDGVSWTVADTQTGQTGWGTTQTRTFAFTDTSGRTQQKGDLLVHNDSDFILLAAGTNDYVLTADSTADTGMAWKEAGGISEDDVLGLIIALG